MRPRKKIIVVDGNEESLSVLSFILENKGYRAIKSFSAQDAIVIVQSYMDKKEEIDLLITNGVVQGMNGNELCQRAKEINPNLSCMIIGDLDQKTLFADILFPSDGRASDMLIEIKSLAARKRGPKPNPQAKYRLEEKERVGRLLAKVAT